MTVYDAKPGQPDFAALFSGSGATKPGDVVNLYDGEYRVGDLVQAPRNRGLTVQAAPGQSPVVVGSVFVTANGTALAGLSVVGPNRWGIRVGACDDITVSNCRVHHLCQYPRSHGIVCMDDGTNHVYSDNVVYKNGVNSLCHGFYIAGAGTKTFRQNVAFENAGYGFHLWTNDGEPPGRYVFDGNVAFAPYRGNFVSGSFNAESIALTDNLFVHPEGTRQPPNGVTVRAKHMVIEGNGFWGGQTPLVLVPDQPVAPQDRTYLIRPNLTDLNAFMVATYTATPGPARAILPTWAGRKYRLWNVLDLIDEVMSEAVVATVPADGVIEIKQGGYDYEPQFGCYQIRFE